MTQKVKELNKEELSKDINEGFRALMGEYLNLAEGFFKEKVDPEIWVGFRKLVLDMGNSHRRLVEAKLNGMNYYKLLIKEGKQNG